jgi:hypothetical protein
MRVAERVAPADEARAERLGAELEASLLRELKHCFLEINRSHFRGALALPVLKLVEARTVLGRWDGARRTLELSLPLVLAAAWGTVTEILKHEMAHQYVHDVLGVRDEAAHGPAFRGVCERMGVDAAAAGMPAAAHAAPGGGRSRVLRRVADLLALARSPNRHEAETAAALAQRLMLKHNVELSREEGRRRYGFRLLGEPKGRVSEAEHILAAILAEHFFVEAIWVPAYRPREGKRGSVLEICGTPENLEICGYVHGFLRGTAERLWAEHKRGTGVRGDRDRRTYLAGVMEGFRERLGAERRRARAEGLVWVGDADLGSYYRRRHPHVRTVRLAVHGRSDVRSHGREAGRNIVLCRGLDARSAGPAVAALPAGRCPRS